MSKCKSLNSRTACVKVDDARIDQLKEPLRSTPQDLDFERVGIMYEMYDESAGDQRTDRTGDVCGKGPGPREVVCHAHEHETAA